MRTIKNIIIVAILLITFSSCVEQREIEQSLQYKAIYIPVDNNIYTEDQTLLKAWNYDTNKPIDGQLVSIWSDYENNWVQFHTDLEVTDIIINGEAFGFIKNLNNTYTIEFVNFEQYNTYRGYIRFQLNYIK